MYVVTIKNDGVPTTIHNEYESIANAKVKIERNSINSFSFDIYPENPGYNLLEMFLTYVSIIDTITGETVFDGRVLQPSPSMDSEGKNWLSVVCESPEGYLKDSLQEYLEEKLWPGDRNRTGLQEFIDYLLTVHNSKVPPEKAIYRGVVDVDTGRTTDNIYKGTNFETTWDCLQSKLVDVFGGEIRVRLGTDGKHYLDYRDVIGSVSSTPIRIGKNMISGSREINPNTLITRLYPRGAKIKKTTVDEQGATREEETEERISIESVNHGIAYIDFDDGIRAYGIVEGEQTWDDVEDPGNLYAKAKAWFEANNRLPVTTKVEALDLSLIGLDIDSFNVYDWYPVYNPLIETDETLEIVSKTIDINEPHKSSIDFGESSTLQSRKIAVLEGLKNQVDYLESKSVTTERNIGYYVKYTMSAIEITEDRIRTTVGEQLVIIGDQIEVVESRVAQVEITCDSIISSVQNLRTDVEKGQTLLESKIEQTADRVTSTVTESMTKYVDGQFGLFDTRVSKIEQTVDKVSVSVTDLRTEVFSEIETKVGSIKLSVSNGTLGSNASISLTVDGKSQSSQNIDMRNVRSKFANENSQVEISAGRVTFNSGTFVVNSTYFSVTANGWLTCTGGTIGGFTIGTYTIYNDSITLYSSGLQLYRDNVSVGHIGCNNINGYSYQRGLSFDLESTANYMCWAAHDGGSSYIIKLLYARGNTNGYTTGRLSVSCNLDLMNYKAYNFWIDPNTGGCSGGGTGTINVKASNDGTYTLTFTHGMLTGW